MELTDKYFKDLKDKKDMTKRNINFFYLLANEYKKGGQMTLANTIISIAQRMKNCLEFWEWDKYIKNKVLNLKIVSRCKNIFCLNCRTVNIIKAIKNFKPHFDNMISSGYHPYFMTLTVPNIELKFLPSEISKMNTAFSKLIRWLEKPFKENNKYYGGYKDRLFDVIGAVKVLEVTIQKSDFNFFHVHFHVILFLKNDRHEDFIKYRPGGYQYRSSSFINYSDADIFIQILWKMAYDSKEISKLKNASSNWEDNYICDIRPMDGDKGIFEVFKYCFKDMDIKNYEVFKHLYIGLKSKRLRQGYGKLYNLKLEDKDFDDDVVEDDIKNYLEFKDEEPETVYNNFNGNTQKDGDYKKISIFKSSKS